VGWQVKLCDASLTRAEADPECVAKEANGDIWGRAAEGAEGVGCGERVFDSPLGRDLGGGTAPSPEIFST